MGRRDEEEKRGAQLLDDAAAKRPIARISTSAKEEYLDLYVNGLPRGDLTGWSSVDELYTVAPGQMTIVTGWPSSGKSEWLDALFVNLVRGGWKFIYHSPENRPMQLHLAKLAEKLSGKPFGAGPTERMSQGEAVSLLDDMGVMFRFIESKTDEALSVGAVMRCANELLPSMGTGKIGLVIDPWNELEHIRPVHMSETEHISQTLSAIRNWSRNHNVHTWVVAHPQKMRRDDRGELPIPSPDMISGSQNWWNKADNCITVHRVLDDEKSEVEIHVKKIRFKHIGHIGMASLRYDRTTGRYHEPTYSPFDVKARRAT